MCKTFVFISTCILKVREIYFIALRLTGSIDLTETPLSTVYNAMVILRSVYWPLRLRPMTAGANTTNRSDSNCPRRSTMISANNFTMSQNQQRSRPPDKRNSEKNGNNFNEHLENNTAVQLHRKHSKKKRNIPYTYKLNNECRGYRPRDKLGPTKPTESWVWVLE